MARRMIPKDVSICVNLYRLLRTTMAMASRLISMTILIPSLSDSSLISDIPSIFLARTSPAIFSNSFAVSLIYISFAYSGWNAVAYLGGEIKDPGRNIPLSLFAGTFLVLGLYLLLNMVYIYALPVKEMSGVLEVGKTAAVSLFGDNISRYFAAAIAIGILSAVSAMIMTGPRVYYAMSKDGVFFKLFGKIDSIHKTPAYSIFLQATLAIIMVVTSAFDKLLLYIGFTLAVFAMLTVAGMIVLRIKKTFPGAQI